MECDQPAAHRSTQPAGTGGDLLLQRHLQICVRLEHVAIDSQQGAALGALAGASALLAEMHRNAVENRSIAALDGNDDFQRYADAAQEEDHDRSALGRPLPLLVLGFGGGPGGGRSLSTELVRRVMASRQRLSADKAVYVPMMGLADGSGSFSPHKRMPYAFAVAAGMSDAGMQMAIAKAEDGCSLRGNGYANTKQVVASAGQRACVVLDLSEGKKDQSKMLPGLLHAAEEGYYAVIVGKRQEAVMSVVTRAFPPHRLLRLSSADVADGAAASSAAATIVDPLCAKASWLLDRVVDWWLGRPEVVQEAAQAAARQAATAAAAAQPVGRRVAQRQQQELEQSGQLCPCGCGKDAQEHMSGMLALAFADNKSALRRFAAGDVQYASAIGNLLGAAVGPLTSSTQEPESVEMFGGEQLFDAAFVNLAAAQRQPNYPLWQATLGVLSNCCRFAGERGEAYRQSLLRRGLADEVVVASGSKDGIVREFAAQVQAALEAHECWQRECNHCGAAEHAASAQLRFCAGCRRRLYCSQECQRAAWKAGQRPHKAECQRLAVL